MKCKKYFQSTVKQSTIKQDIPEQLWYLDIFQAGAKMGKCIKCLSFMIGTGAELHRVKKKLIPSL